MGDPEIISIKHFDKDGNEIPYDSLSESAKQYVDSLLNTVAADNYTGTREPTGTYFPAVSILLGFAFLGYILVRKVWKSQGTEVLGGWHDKREVTGGGLFAVEKYRDADERFRDLTKDYLVYHGTDIVLADEPYDKILSKRLPYYRKLAPDLKDSFIQRTRAFLKSKTFLIKTDEPFVDMPVLISATAIQLTFGLKDYLLDHYQYIRIFPEEYFAKGTIKVLAGHVYGNTITLAWNYFLEGHEDHTDGVNLGLHEMAHALYFQFVHATTIKSRSFVSNFKEVLAEGAEMYQLEHASPSNLFSENAYKNLQEFWAESIELFFERPSDLQNENADIFDTLAEMLNQNPSNSFYPVLS